MKEIVTDLVKCLFDPRFMILHISLSYQSTNSTKENNEVSLTHTGFIKPILVLRDSQVSLHDVHCYTNLL